MEKVTFQVGDRTLSPQAFARVLAAQPEEAAEVARRGFEIAGPRPLIDALRATSFGHLVGEDGAVEPEASVAAGVAAGLVVGFVVGFAVGYLAGSSGKEPGGEESSEEEAATRDGGSTGDTGDDGGEGGTGGGGSGAGQ